MTPRLGGSALAGAARSANSPRTLLPGSYVRIAALAHVGTAVGLSAMLVMSNALAAESDSNTAFPSLTWVLDTARANAPGVVAQRGALNAADATKVGANLHPVANPYVEVFSDRRLSGTGTSLQGNVWIPVEISGQRGRRVAEAEALFSWQHTGLEAARAQAMGRAMAAFGAIVVGAERASFQAALLATSKEEATYYEGRFRQGDATLREAKLAAVEVARNSVSLQEVQADLTRARSALAALLGLPFVAAPTGQNHVPPESLWQSVTRSIEELARQSPAVVVSEREASYFDKVQNRQASDAHAPFSFIVSAARGDFGDARVGGGLAWTLPTFRRNQGDRARAHAEQQRALEERHINEVRTYATLRGMITERAQLNEALRELGETGVPAAEAALEASLAVHRAGKGDLLHVLAARRDLALMKVGGLLLVLREWTLLADFVTLTGKAP